MNVAIICYTTKLFSNEDERIMAFTTFTFGFFLIKFLLTSLIPEISRSVQTILQRHSNIIHQFLKLERKKVKTFKI